MTASRRGGLSSRVGAHVGRSFRAGRRAILVLALWLALDASLLACPICFQVEDGPVSAGVRAAVLVLIGVTGTVLSGFAMFIVRFVRRTR
jgi:hypothetical protein